MKNRFQHSFLSVALGVILVSLTLFNCSDDDPEPAATGVISGRVTDLSSQSALADATVVVFDATTNSPVATTVTNGNGDYSFELAEGNYFLKFYKQGYQSVPPQGIEAVPFSVTVGQTTAQSAEMAASAIANAGSIAGKVSVGATAQSGALVVAEGDGTAFSAVSDKDGNFTIFNVPPSSYSVKAYLAEYSSDVASVSVAENGVVKDISITLTRGSAGKVTGTFKVISQTTIATPPTTMEVSLVHPITKETIPGLSQSLPYSSSISYAFANVPDGTYVVRATYANDYIVIDPDYITKFGDYTVSVTGGTPTPASVDIVATSAVILTSPTNEMATTAPVESSATPTFKWQPYASTSDYVIEVTDASTGAVVWGGFTNSNGTLVKNIVIPSNTTSVTFNSDGNATGALVSGKIYRWRIFASKDNNQTGSWNLIAASEDQMGLIKIQ